MIMKKVFISVCILASLYLAAQTSFAKRLIANGYSSDPVNTVDSYSLQQQLANLESSIQAMKVNDEKQDLLSRIERLERELGEKTTLINSAPENEKADVTKLIKNDSSSVDESKFALDKSVIENAQSTNLPIPVDASSNTETSQKAAISSETKKRLQQQAALRDLSQKLELLALDTLAN